MKKSLMIAFLVLMISILIIGCNTDKKDEPKEPTKKTQGKVENEQKEHNQEQNKNLVELVKKVEMLDMKLSFYGIDYDKYMKDIKSAFNDIYTDEKHFARLFDEMDKDTYNSKRAKIPKSETNKYTAEIYISNVYESNKTMKNVYVKNIIKTCEGEDSKPTYITKRYIITENSNNWQIIGVDWMISYDENKVKKYTIFNNKPVDYTVIFKMSEKDNE
ncbi:hypothetical protein PV797_01865 [Clostridiaceae bacterium M8S5]|nr:hypothetical protein PV797_01865 [Clostridiaceae bacterium M8S5]